MLPRRPRFTVDKLSILSSIESEKQPEVRDKKIQSIVTMIGGVNQFIRWRGVDEWVALMNLMSPELRRRYEYGITFDVYSLAPIATASQIELAEKRINELRALPPLERDSAIRKMINEKGTIGDYRRFYGNDIWRELLSLTSPEFQKEIWIKLVTIKSQSRHFDEFNSEYIEAQTKERIQSEIEAEINHVNGAANYINANGIDS